MEYYDIHTHHAPVVPGVFSIVNLDPMRKEFDFLSDKTTILSEWERFSVGIHPWYIGETEQQLDALERCLSLPGVVAVGEAGLDKLAVAPMALQEAVFKAQARMAEQRRLPVILHCVKAWQELGAVRKAWKPRMPWIVHGFRGNGALAEQLIREGYYLSFGNYFNLEALRASWPERMFLETDDKPLGIRAVYAKVAGALSVREELLIQVVAENVARVGLFK